MSLLNKCWTIVGSKPSVLFSGFTVGALGSFLCLHNARDTKNTTIFKMGFFGGCWSSMLYGLSLMVPKSYKPLIAISAHCTSLWLIANSKTIY